LNTFTWVLVVYFDMPGIIWFNPEVLLTDGAHEFFYSSVTDHMYFEGTGSSPTRTTYIAFVPLFAGMGLEGVLFGRGWLGWEFGGTGWEAWGWCDRRARLFVVVEAGWTSCMFDLIVRLKGRGEFLRSGSRGYADGRVVVRPLVCWREVEVRVHVGVKGYPIAFIRPMRVIGGGGVCSVLGSGGIGGEWEVAGGRKLWVRHVMMRKLLWVVDHWGVGGDRDCWWMKEFWEEFADTGERLSGAGEMRGHKCTGSREDKVGRKRHIYYRTSSAGGVVRCGSTKAIHKKEKAANERIVGGRYLRWEQRAQHRLW
jgi:hypothetical protein